MFGSETKRMKNAQFLSIVALGFCLISVLLNIARGYVLDAWVAKKENVVCVPSDSEYTFPIVHSQSFYNPVYEDAKVKTFVAEYIRLTKNESVVDYHSVTSSERYEKAKLSQNKWTAIEMSTGEEQVRAKDAYAKSSDLYKYLSENGVGWVFLIDKIIVRPAPGTGTLVAEVFGEYQTTFDQAKVDVPHETFGYKVVTLLIVQGLPSSDGKGAPLNKSGLYVYSSTEQTLDPSAYREIRDHSGN